jgi:hypothetical protein
VFSASNVEFVTRTRTDHLANADKKKIKGSDGFQKLFGWGNDDKVPEDSVKERGRDTAVVFVTDIFCFCTLRFFP